MLLERAQGLSAKIGQYEKLKGTADEAAQFKTRADQLSAVADRLDKARDALDRFARAGIAVQFVPGDARLSERARTLRLAVDENPHAIADPPFNIKYEFTDRLVAIAEASAQAMLRAWQMHVRSLAQSQSDEVLNALQALPQFRRSISSIRQCRAEIQALAAAVPQDLEGAIERINVLAQAQREAWAELTADGIPAPVIGFLKACGSEGATLTALTAEVRTWLEERKLLGAFKILIR
jgi:hypothetical protein